MSILKEINRLAPEDPIVEKDDKIVCPECLGKGQKKYPHNGEMEYDHCRMCDGKKRIKKIDEAAEEPTEDHLHNFTVMSLQHAIDIMKHIKDNRDVFDNPERAQGLLDKVRKDLIDLVNHVKE